MGKPRDPDYFRKWRAAHPEYRARDAERRRRRGHPADRSAEYARRNAKRAREYERTPEPLPELFPDLVRSTFVLFLDEDLARDLRQEAALAMLEGRDVDAAVAAYRSRERLWAMFAAPILRRDTLT